MILPSDWGPRRFMRTRPGLVMAMEMESQARCVYIKVDSTLWFWVLVVVAVVERSSLPLGLPTCPPAQNFSVTARPVLFGRIEMNGTV